MKEAIFKGLVILALLAIAILGAGFVYLDREAWVCSRQLTTAVNGARQVVLVEYSEDVEISRRVATPEEISRLRKATGDWPRPFFPKAFLCFIPHHRIEIVRADGSEMRSDVCFLCDKFAINDGPPFAPLPPYLAKSLTTFFTSVGMAPKTSDEYAAIVASRRARSQ
jgi:hypothetical protein